MSFEKKFSYGYIQKYTDICSSWASINGAVQMLSLTPSRTMSAGKCLKSERLLALLQEHIIFNVKGVEVHKMSDVFRAKLYYKISDLFP